MLAGSASPCPLWRPCPLCKYKLQTDKSILVIYEANLCSLFWFIDDDDECYSWRRLNTLSAFRFICHSRCTGILGLPRHWTYVCFLAILSIVFKQRLIFATIFDFTWMQYPFSTTVIYFSACTFSGLWILQGLSLSLFLLSYIVHHSIKTGKECGQS